MWGKSSVKFRLVGCAVLALLASRLIQAQELPQVKEITYNWRGYQVYYKTAGPTTRAEGETAAPVIFLHGFGSSSFVWRKNLAALAQARKVVALDLLGFGKSDKPAIEYSPDVWVNLVHEFARANGFPKVALVGSDLGGLIAAEFALRFPDKTEKLILVNSLGISCNLSRTQRLFFKPVIGRASFRLFFRAAYVGRVLRNSVYGDPQLVTDEVIQGYHRPFRSPGAASAYRNVGKRMRRWRLGARAKEITVPTLIVWGEDDRVTPLADAVELDSLIPNSTIATIPGAGHYPQAESPAPFNSYLSRYLRRPPAASSTAP
jgi:pimeloyl-ACP methyl ester carboxylesterase